MQNSKLLLAAVALAAAGVFLLSRAETDPIQEPGLSSHGSGAVEGDDTGGGLEIARPKPPTANNGRGLTPDLLPDEATVIRISCLSAADRSPLEGICLFQGENQVAGPSGADGILKVEEPGYGKRTLWASGWVSQTAYSPALPAEALFVAADATLEIRLLEVTAEYQVIKTLLQTRTPAAPPEGPWTPILVQAELDSLVARGVSPGSYDLYLWVTFQRGEPRAITNAELEIPAGETTRLELDIPALFEANPSSLDSVDW